MYKKKKRFLQGKESYKGVIISLGKGKQDMIIFIEYFNEVWESII